MLPDGSQAIGCARADRGATRRALAAAASTLNLGTPFVAASHHRKGVFKKAHIDESSKEVQYTGSAIHSPVCLACAWRHTHMTTTRLEAGVLVCRLEGTRVIDLAASEKIDLKGKNIHDGTLVRLSDAAATCQMLSTAVLEANISREVIGRSETIPLRKSILLVEMTISRATATIYGVRQWCTGRMSAGRPSESTGSAKSRSAPEPSARICA